MQVGGAGAWNGRWKLARNSPACKPTSSHAGEVSIRAVSRISQLRGVLVGDRRCGGRFVGLIWGLICIRMAFVMTVLMGVPHLE